MTEKKAAGLSAFSLKASTKIAKILRLFPTPQKRVLSEFEDKGLRRRFYQQLWRNAAKNLGYVYTELGYGYWCLQKKNGQYIKGNINGIELDSNIGVVFTGNKPLTHKFLADVSGYKAPEFCEYELMTLAKANDFMQTAGTPCVVKPAYGTGAGDGITMGVKDYKSLKRASINAASFCNQLMIEETVSGQSFRILILNNRCIHAIRRDPPQIIGDGTLTIAELIKKENQRRLNSGKIVSLFPISIDQECVNTLKSKSLSVKSIPQTGEIVQVKNVVNQNAAEQNIDVTEQVHSSILNTSIAAAKKLGLGLAGIDVLTNDISLPLEETGGVINEINANPGLHHHYLISNAKNIDIAEQIIRHCMEKN